jgi:hypothetical protein
MANEIEDSYCEGEKLTDVANMLRQQADRIAELEKDMELCTTCGGFVFSALTPQKQNEVMAYIYQDPDTLQPALKFANPTNYWATVISTPDIPLYTTPQTKPLTEDELKKLADDYVNAYGYPFPAVSYGLEIQRRLGIK